MITETREKGIRENTNNVFNKIIYTISVISILLFQNIKANAQEISQNQTKTKEIEMIVPTTDLWWLTINNHIYYNEGEQPDIEKKLSDVKYYMKQRDSLYQIFDNIQQKLQTKKAETGQILGNIAADYINQHWYRSNSNYKDLIEYIKSSDFTNISSWGKILWDLKKQKLTNEEIKAIGVAIMIRKICVDATYCEGDMTGVLSKITNNKHYNILAQQNIDNIDHLLGGERYLLEEFLAAIKEYLNNPSDKIFHKITNLFDKKIMKIVYAGTEFILLSEEE